MVSDEAYLDGQGLMALYRAYCDGDRDLFKQVLPEPVLFARLLEHLKFKLRKTTSVGSSPIMRGSRTPRTPTSSPNRTGAGISPAVQPSGFSKLESGTSTPTSTYDVHALMKVKN